jgi:hypothetical protein
MLAGLQNGLRGLQASDLQMDILGTRLSAEASVPFPQINGPAASPTPTSLTLPREEDREAAPAPGKRTSFFQLPGLFPGDTVGSLGGDLAGDMGAYVIAQAAYRLNARVVSAAGHELEVLTRLGQ